jgi:hypothetical protein
MAVIATVDYATNLSYKDLQGAKVSDLNLVLGGLDGVSTSIDTSKLIFVNNEYIDDAYWVNTARVDENNILYLDANELVTFNFRNSTYQIRVLLDSNGDERLYLTPMTYVVDEQKVKILRGEKNVGKEYYSRMGLFNQVPTITAPLEIIYYQSATHGSAGGGIQIIDVDTAVIDPTIQIEGQLKYTSPNGVTFTNGLKITFDSSATEEYRNKTYYVDGVSSGGGPFTVALSTLSNWYNFGIRRTAANTFAITGLFSTSGTYSNITAPMYLRCGSYTTSPIAQSALIYIDSCSVQLNTR